MVSKYRSVQKMRPKEHITSENVSGMTKILVEIPSETGKEQAIGDWLVIYFKELGMSEVKRLPVDEAGDTIVAVLKGGDGPKMMLNFHIDTFDAFDGWDTEPFKVVEKEGRLYGLGAHDMKGGAACALIALEAIVKSGTKLGGDLIISGTSDEEYWSRGAHALVNSGMLDGVKYNIVPEPANHATILIGQRGRHVFKLRFYGSSVSAAYDEGINAVVDASKVVAEFEKHKPDGFGYLDEYDMRGTLCVTGLHSGGDKIYVPELAEVTIDRHILPGQSAESAANQIKQIILAAGIKGRYELTWDERPTPAPSSYITDPNSMFVQTAKRNLEKQLGEDVKFALARSVADTNHLAVYGKVPTIIMGPSGGNTCEANEWVDIDSLPQIARAILGTVLDLLGSE
jgi:acetylornithine deacetylase/succinyl-diaminopimelate desuccinylase-like protein